MGASASDMIIYIGVPLAILGVTPIFWLAHRAITKKLTFAERHREKPSNRCVN